MELSAHSRAESFTYACTSVLDGDGGRTDNTQKGLVLCTSPFGDHNDECRLDLEVVKGCESERKWINEVGGDGMGRKGMKV